MKINLNLLPPEQKQKLLKTKIIKMIIWQEFLIVFFLIMAATFLAGVYLVEHIKLEAQKKVVSQKNNEKEFREIEQYEKKFQEINQKINLIARGLEGTFFWEVPLEKIFHALPEGTEIKEIKTDNYDITLSGEIPNREKMMLLKNNLEKDNCFSKVDIPIANLMLKENINFHIQLHITENCLKLK